MKTLGIIAVILITLVLGLLYIKSEFSPIVSPWEGTERFEPEATEEVGIPKKISIPSIDVNAEIISLGQDSYNRMDIPGDRSKVGWYSPGYRVGGLGTAVLAGHLDNPDGSQAVFSKLAELPRNGEIHIWDDKGTKYTFIVEDKQIYNADNLPLNDIFNTYGEERLNIITCDGDLVNGSYTKRLVIYSVAGENE